MSSNSSQLCKACVGGDTLSSLHSWHPSLAWEVWTRFQPRNIWAMLHTDALDKSTFPHPTTTKSSKKKLFLPNSCQTIFWLCFQVCNLKRGRKKNHQTYLIMLPYNVWQTIVVSAELYMCCKACGNRLDSHISFTSGHSWGALVQWSQWQNLISSKGLSWDHTFSPHLFYNKGYWVSASHPSTEACNTLQKKYFSWYWDSKRALSTLASFSD